MEPEHSASKPTVGWIGTGVMGKSMCHHLLKAGYALNVYNRTKAKADDLIEEGAKWLAPEALAAGSDVVVLMLGFPKDVSEMVLGEHGILAKMKKGYTPIWATQVPADRPHHEQALLGSGYLHSGQEARHRVH